jgi:hypothetical protein
MGKIMMLLYIVVLFVVLTPGILLTLPPKGSKLVVAIVHAIIFAIILHFTYKQIKHLIREGFTGGPIPDCSKASPTKFCTCPSGYQYLVDNNTCIPSEGFSGYEDLPVCTDTYKGPCNPRARMSDDASVF